MDRNERNLEIVRQTAQILSSGGTLSETFERFCLMLAEFIDASVVFIAVKRDESAFIDFAYDHGESSHPRRAVRSQSQTQRVLDTGRPIHIHTLDELHGPLIPLKQNDDSSSAMFVPLRFGTDTIGVLSVQTTREHAYTDDDVRLLETCALYAAVSVQAEAQSTPPGVGSRRAFERRLKDDWMRGAGREQAMTLALLDVDWFKRFNDVYGHVAGDACLGQVAQAVRTCVDADVELFARYGGAEFVALYRDGHSVDAIDAAERMLHAVRSLGVPNAASPLGRVTASVGIASAAAGSMNDPGALVRAAERAMRAAKSAGRDRVVVDTVARGPSVVRQRRAYGNIVGAATTLYGRTLEVATLSDPLAMSPVVTIAGAAGLGKTRVAIAAAQRKLAAFPDGAWVVHCAHLAGPGDLEAEVLAVLGIPEPFDTSPREALLDALRPHTMLLVFDEYGPVREELRELCVALSHAAPRVTVMATGAKALDVDGEELFELQPLHRMDAVTLFVERAQSAVPDFELNDRKRKIVDTICATLDNVPLAIELVASHAGVLTLEQMLAALDERDDDLPPSLKGRMSQAMALSRRLLTPHAQLLFERLSLFPVSGSADAVRDICSGESLHPWQVVDALDELAAAGFITKLKDARERRRYALPGGAWAYAAARFQSHGGRAQAVERFVAFYAAFVHRLAGRLEGPDADACIDALNEERANLRAALRYALVDRVDLVAGAEMVARLQRFWSITGRGSEARRWQATS